VAGFVLVLLDRFLDLRPQRLVMVRPLEKGLYHAPKRAVTVAFARATVAAGPIALGH
jgi:hypothetical protein